MSAESWKLDVLGVLHYVVTSVRNFLVADKVGSSTDRWLRLLGLADPVVRGHPDGRRGTLAPEVGRGSSVGENESLFRRAPKNSVLNSLTNIQAHADFHSDFLPGLASPLNSWLCFI